MRRYIRTGSLTKRELEMLIHICNGLQTKQAAKEMGISESTADGHRAKIYQRLGIHDIPGLVKYAIREGIISL